MIEDAVGTAGVGGTSGGATGANKFEEVIGEPAEPKIGADAGAVGAVIGVVIGADAAAVPPAGAVTDAVVAECVVTPLAAVCAAAGKTNQPGISEMLNAVAKMSSRESALAEECDLLDIICNQGALTQGYYRVRRTTTII